MQGELPTNPINVRSGWLSKGNLRLARFQLSCFTRLSLLTRSSSPNIKQICKQMTSNHNLIEFETFLQKLSIESFRCSRVDIPSCEEIYDNNGRIILYKDKSSAKVLHVYHRLTQEIQKIPLKDVLDLLSFSVSNDDRILYFPKSRYPYQEAHVIHNLTTPKETIVYYSIGGYPKSLCLDKIIRGDFLDNGDLIFVQPTGILIIDSKVQTTRRLVHASNEIQFCQRNENILLLGSFDSRSYEIFTFDLVTLSVAAKLKFELPFTNSILGDKYVYIFAFNGISIYDAKTLNPVGKPIEKYNSSSMSFINDYLIVTSFEAFDLNDYFQFSFDLLSQDGESFAKYYYVTSPQNNKGKFSVDLMEKAMIIKDLNVLHAPSIVYLFDLYKFIKFGHKVHRSPCWDTFFRFK